MQEIHPLDTPDRFERIAMRPMARAYALHFLLLFVTLVTATIAGTLYPFGSVEVMPTADPQSTGELIEFIFSLPARYVVLIGGVIGSLVTDWELLKNGLKFSLSLLFILISHEMGHYVACRIYGVDATLPYFIPTPPMIGPAGTFGAFIKIMSPMPSRKAVFDIGVAGPIAGFIALIPIAVIGVMTMERTPFVREIPEGNIVFSNPLMMQLIAAVFSAELNFLSHNPFYFAAWVGLLVTALNLIPSGQLDGGHAVYAVLGERAHYWSGRIAFPIMAILSIAGFYYFNSPSGFLIAILLGIMMRVGHPQPWDQTPIDGKRKVIAFITLVIFVLSFVPFPIKIT